MNYKEAFYELKSLFDDVPHNGSLAPIKEVADTLAEKAEEHEKVEAEKRVEAGKNEQEKDPFKLAVEKY